MLRAVLQLCLSLHLQGLHLQTAEAVSLGFCTSSQASLECLTGIPEHACRTLSQQTSQATTTAEGLVLRPSRMQLGQGCWGFQQIG